MKEIFLTEDQVTIVDDNDFDWLNQWCWRLFSNPNKNLYAKGSIPTYCGRKHIFMHRLLLNPLKGLLVDHINGDGLDNRRSNLRICTHSQNLFNAKKRSGLCKYKGISYRNNRSKPWQACIYAHNKRYQLGFFATEEEAALAYNEKARELHGEFARLNVI